jgi:hypothetical protein
MTNNINASILKEALKKNVEERLSQAISNTIDKEDTIAVYHGTSSYYLNTILNTGILPRSETNNSNFDDTSPSIENMTYLTNKWHYIYALNSCKELQEKGITDNNFPTYIECRIPKSLLEVDEDFLYSTYVSNKLKSFNKSNKSEFVLTWEECLAHYATVGVAGSIPRKYIVSFTILGDIDYFKNSFVSEDSQYYKEFMKWIQGKGKGK